MNSKTNKLSFSKDMSGRESIALNIMKLIEANYLIEAEQESFVILLNSPWGSGKTDFIKRWRSMLEQDEYNKDFDSVYYNAWEYDDFEHPLYPLLREIYTDSFNEEMDRIFRGIFSIESLKLSGKLFFPNRASHVEEYIELLTKNEVKIELDVFDSHNSLKNGFKSILSKASEKKRLIIFIDELDRCEPGFALKTLDTIKHYFNIRGITFILSVDLKQLAGIAEKRYGPNFDCVGYLNKFYDIKVDLPEISCKDYLRYLIKKYNDIDILKAGLKALNSKIDEIADLCSEIYMSLRDINIVLRHYLYFISENNEFDNTKSYLLYFYLILLKIKLPLEFDGMTKSKIDRYEVGDFSNKYRTECEVLKSLLGFLSGGGGLIDWEKASNYIEQLSKSQSEIVMCLTDNLDLWETGENINDFIRHKLAGINTTLS